MPSKRGITFVIHNVDRPRKVTSAAKIKQSYDKKTRTLTISAKGVELPLEVTITK